MKINDTVELNIEKLTYGADGLARFGENSFVVFIPNVLPDEKIKARIVSINKSFARAELIEIIEKSPYRIKPLCPLYNACGSCQLGICDYDYSIKLKSDILDEIFNGYNIKPFIKSPISQKYRHKIQYPARETKNSKRVKLGYFKPKSHELTDIKFCPMQPDIINEITQFIRKNYNLGCYDEKSNKGLLKNIVFRYSKKSDILLIFVINKSNYNGELDDFALQLSKKFPQIKGVFINLNPKNTNTILSDEIVKILGEDKIVEELDNKKYFIGPLSFFQINPYLAEELFKAVKDNIKDASNILDSYGGVGTIGIFVSGNDKKITLVEENLEATTLAESNYKQNNIENYEILNGDSKKHFIDFKNKNRVFDCAILDPPRSGCDKSGLDAISEVTKKIIYISCNPQTLKRDIKHLENLGFRVDFIQGYDMFPYTYHIETLAILNKQ